MIKMFDSGAIQITLSRDDLKLAAKVSRLRDSENRHVGRPDGKVVANGLMANMEGAVGELAVSKALSLPWDGKFFKDNEWLTWRNVGHDVSGLEIRSTSHKLGRLIAHPKDKGDSPFILVRLHEKPNILIAGWAFGRDIKKAEFWQDVGYGRPCFYLPNDKLRPITELKTILQKGSVDSDIHRVPMRSPS